MDRPRHRITRRSCRSGSRRIIKRHFRQCRRINYRHDGVVEGPNGGGKSIHHRIDNRKRPAGSRPFHLARRHEISPTTFQQNRRSNFRYLALARGHRARHPKRLSHRRPHSTGWLESRPGATAFVRYRRRSLRHLRLCPQLHFKNAQATFSRPRQRGGGQPQRLVTREILDDVAVCHGAGGAAFRIPRRHDRICSCFSRHHRSVRRSDHRRHRRKRG